MSLPLWILQEEVLCEGVESRSGEGILLLEQIIQCVQQAQLQSLPLVVHQTTIRIRL